jgi:hypothetical protein
MMNSGPLQVAAPELLDAPAVAAALVARGLLDVSVTVTLAGDGDAVSRVLEVGARAADGGELTATDAAVVAEVVAGHDPEELTADRYEIPADGATAAAVTYRRRTASGSVVFTVNGQPFQVPAVDGVAVAGITSATAGPVVVTAGGCALTLTAG